MWASKPSSGASGSTAHTVTERIVITPACHAASLHHSNLKIIPELGITAS